MSADEPRRADIPKDDIPASMRALIEVWQAAAQGAAHIAHAKRTIFLAYVAEGFTEAQALELVKTL